jgi:hypothetical protein
VNATRRENSRSETIPASLFGAEQPAPIPYDTGV